MDSREKGIARHAEFLLSTVTILVSRFPAMQSEESGLAHRPPMMCCWRTMGKKRGIQKGELGSRERNWIHEEGNQANCIRERELNASSIVG